VVFFDRDDDVDDVDDDAENDDVDDVDDDDFDNDAAAHSDHEVCDSQGDCKMYRWSYMVLLLRC